MCIIDMQERLEVQGRLSVLFKKIPADKSRERSLWERD